jgi:hypothetical protein
LHPRSSSAARAPLYTTDANGHPGGPPGKNTILMPSKCFFGAATAKDVTLNRNVKIRKRIKIFFLMT